MNFDATNPAMGNDELLAAANTALEQTASEGTSLRDRLREGASDAELKDLLTRVWGLRSDRYSEERTELAPLENQRRKIEMYQIGG